ncbi:hypothetical protein N5T96_10395 [Aliarcobacter butzleri]|uniref:hypothetical protein n=1 Tax=Aliarcobacter butzleri TaxID=28197 RepID=UPI0021B3FBBC|nr:hypothetical protein [Aliarcobacter butzleri]MCT7566741.1 hypothetical protein [Aliarcobacter butzleri]MCT7570138.1 hypothetical protein [Aliarcobacter butzleri]MCT7633307.1 hypothetical protein [Aliarcobacter butzleri]
MKLKKSFTLIETLVVLMIVFILSLVGVNVYNGYIDTTKENSSNYSNSTNNRVAAIDNLFLSEEEKLYKERREKYKGVYKDLLNWGNNSGAGFKLIDGGLISLKELRFKFSPEEANKYKELLIEVFNGTKFQKENTPQYYLYLEPVVLKSSNNIEAYYKDTLNSFFGLK